LLEVFGTASAVCLALGSPEASHVLMAGLPHASIGDDHGESVAHITRLASPLAEGSAGNAGRSAPLGPDASALPPANELDRLLLRKTAHEIRTPLSVMKNYLGVLKLKIPEADPVSSELAILGEEIDRVTGLVRELTESAQDEPVQWVSVNAVVADMLALVGKRNPAEALIEIRTQLDSDLPMIFSRRNRVKQVVLNLLKNAFEAQPNGGAVEVITRREPDSAGQDSVRFIVRDHGPGLSEEIRARLFQPGNTSKSDRGHGLGLHIVRTAIASLGGRIGVSSRAGQGAEFVVELPVAASSAPGQAAVSSPQQGEAELLAGEDSRRASAPAGDNNGT
jgi:signal transduction histidine kinase